MIPPKNIKQKNIFVHIPKTAGTSFVNIIYNNIPQRRVYPNYVEKVIINKGHYLPEGKLLEHQNELLKNKYWLMGHMHYNNAKRIWPDARIYMIFRSPKQRIISHIYHLMREHEPFKEMTFEEILRGNKYALDFQANLLGYRRNNPNKKELQQKLQKMFFIGITEYFEASLKLLKVQTRWSNMRSVFYNQGVYKDDLFQGHMDLINPAPIEMEVYQYAKEEFFKRCEMANIKIE